MAGGRRRKLLLSKIYSFGCARPSFQEDHSQVGGPGYSRVAFLNEPDCFEATNLNYGVNHISTTKYTFINFIPKSLYEQFRRVANVYFLISGILSFTPLAPFTAVSAILPLVAVIAATMLKEGLEDWRRRQQDNEVNNRKIAVHQGDGTFNSTEWKNLRVGDVVKVEKDNYFPADLILLSSSFDDGVCYVETMNLDGETNLKLKQALDVTSSSQSDSSICQFKGLVKCEDPNANLYSFVGTMDYEGQQYPLSPQQLLLRDSKLRNTEYVYGAVVFTSHDTKVMQNATSSPSKRSSIERKMDKIIYVLLSFMVVLSVLGSIFFGVITDDDLSNGKLKRWYLRPDDTTILFDPKKSAAAGFFHFLSAMILYSYFIPISLYISIEIVKVLQSMFINQDINMYYEEADKPAHARTSNLNEELGLVDTILTDKTGTLTCNSMEFIKCSIAGTAYGRGVTEVERAMVRKNGPSLYVGNETEDDGHVVKGPAVKGFNFKDERVMNGNWVGEPHSDFIRIFFQVLAICHTVIPEVDDNSRKVSYEAESPDEAAFVVAARELGFEFFQRTQTSISVRELDPSLGMTMERKYKLLNILEFNSTRKRMSVIIKTEDNKLFLLCKGADSVMFNLLGTNRRFEEETREHINEYADAGLRTLVLAYRELDEEEFIEFNKRYIEAKTSISADRDEKIAAAAEMMEKDLVLLGATAVEDKLQSGVPGCIDKLAQAGIKIWVLTGDKLETAINIGFACSLLRQGMKQILVSLDSTEIKALEKEGNKDTIAKASKDNVTRQINEGIKLVTSSSNQAFALIIDGKSLTFALMDDIKDTFLALATACASVICCRSSPKQKALVTRLVKLGTGKTTLGIGDGANDVGMLQEADIGIGISGFEGMQAVMASDIAIAQFQYLERLLLVHGHWCYRRISSMICYFFYKNITFGVTIFLYEAYTSFSAQAAYNDWFMSLYNVFFTSLAVLALGIFDQDVSPKYCLKFPLLYQEGIQNLLFKWVRILGWMILGILNAVTIFFFCKLAYQHQAFREGGETVGAGVFGVAMYTCVVWVVNVQMAIFVKYFTLVQHLAIWGGIALWYLFLLVYGAIKPTITTNAFMVFVEACAPAPSFWLVTLLVVIATVVPYFTFSAVQTRFFPMLHEMIQWLRLDAKANDPEYDSMVRTRSVRQNLVGYSARRESLRL